MADPTPPKATAGCCRALVVVNFRTEEEVLAHVRKSTPYASETERDNLRFFQALIPLPLDWDLWPEDSKLALPRERLLAPPRQHYRCRLLGSNGLCTIYPRRTYICSRYEPQADACSDCSQFRDGKCCPPALDENAACPSGTEG